MREELSNPEQKKGKAKLTIGNMRFMKEAQERERQEPLKLLNEMGDDEDGMDEYGSDGEGRGAGRVSFTGLPDGANVQNEVESEADSDDEERVRKEYENAAGGQGTGSNVISGDLERIVRETADVAKGFTTKPKGRISADVTNGEVEKEVEEPEDEPEKKVSADTKVNANGEHMQPPAGTKKSRRAKRKRRADSVPNESLEEAADKPRKIETKAAPSATKKPRKVHLETDLEKDQINPLPKRTGLDEDRARMEMVARAFAGLGGADEEDFAASKAAQVDAEIDAETHVDAQAAKVLPGWGTWDGAGAKRNRSRKRSAFAQAAAERLAEARARAVEARKDTNNSTLQLATARPAAVRALTLGSVPFPFRSAREWERELQSSAIPELAPGRAYSARIQPSITARKGVAIEPIQFNGKRASQPDDHVELRGKGKITKSKGKRAVLERRKKTAKARESKRKALLA